MDVLTKENCRKSMRYMKQKARLLNERILETINDVEEDADDELLTGN